MPSGQRGPVVIAPVGNDRAWAIPHYAAGLRQQTLPPAGYCLLLSPGSDDVRNAILDADWGAAIEVHQSKERFYPREQRNDDRSDPNRTAHFTRLRNELRANALAMTGDWFVSLDTDMMLDDPETFAAMRKALFVPEQDGLERDGQWRAWRRSSQFDAVAITAYLSPHGARSGCFNVGWWMAGDPGSLDRIWRRADTNDFLVRHSPVPVDVFMAAFAIRRFALGTCKYAPHQLGEDLGFADSFDRSKFTCAWLKEIEARHVWNEGYLERTAA